MSFPRKSLCKNSLASARAAQSMSARTTRFTGKKCPLSEPSRPPKSGTGFPSPIHEQNNCAYRALVVRYRDQVWAGWNPGNSLPNFATLHSGYFFLGAMPPAATCLSRGMAWLEIQYLRASSAYCKIALGADDCDHFTDSRVAISFFKRSLASAVEWGEE